MLLTQAYFLARSRAAEMIEPTAAGSAVASSLVLRSKPFFSVVLRSATTPIAMAVSRESGGDLWLTAAHLFGCGWRSARALRSQRVQGERAASQGLSARHGFARPRHGVSISGQREEIGASAVLGMRPNGNLTAFVVPILMPFVANYLRIRRENIDEHKDLNDRGFGNRRADAIGERLRANHGQAEWRKRFGRDR
jgi:putative effector of murein hydrolase